MKAIGFRMVPSESCVYVWKDNTGGKVVVLTYVNDCHIIGKTREGVQHNKAELQKRFKLRDLGTNWILGIDIQHNHSTHQITCPNSNPLLTCSRTLVRRMPHQL
jgi:hypothetical protein